LSVSSCFFKWRQVCALDVFDNSNFEGASIVCIDYNYWNFVFPRSLGSPPPPLPCDDLVCVRKLRDHTDQDRLDDPALLYRIGELIQPGVVKALSGIARVWSQELNRRSSRSKRVGGWFGIVRGGAKKSGKPAPKTRSMFGTTGFFSH
jgi:hypothetical protein